MTTEADDRYIGLDDNCAQYAAVLMAPKLGIRSGDGLRVLSPNGLSMGRATASRIAGHGARSRDQNATNGLCQPHQQNNLQARFGRTPKSLSKHRELSRKKKARLVNVPASELSGALARSIFRNMRVARN